MSATRAKKTRRAARESVAAAHPGRSRTPWLVLAVIVVAVAALFGIYRSASHNGSPTASEGGGAGVRYAVGSPGVGALAPDFALPNVTSPTTHATTDGAVPGTPASVRLSDYRGKTVLLYFHEGLGCQPCWNQIRDLQHDPVALRSAGVDQLLTITTGPPDLVAQKMADDRLTEPALVDTDLAVSRRYQANQYGMMGTDRDGHSFVLVGPDGRIQWRADYGGPPNYTMYVPVGQLLADLRAGRRPA